MPQMDWLSSPGHKEPQLHQTPGEARTLAGGSHPYDSDLEEQAPQRGARGGQAAGVLVTKLLPGASQQKTEVPPGSVTFPQGSGEQERENSPSSGSNRPDCPQPAPGKILTPLVDRSPLAEGDIEPRREEVPLRSDRTGWGPRVRRSLSWGNGTGGLPNPFSVRPSFEGDQVSGPALPAHSEGTQDSREQVLGQTARSSRPSRTTTSS